MQRSRTPSNLSESLHRQLNSYAIAASAAGVSILALVLPVDARIVYTRTHHVFEQNTIYHLDLNHDGIADFTLGNYYRHQSGEWATMRANALRSNRFVVSTDRDQGALALRKGTEINGRKLFGGFGLMEKVSDSTFTEDYYLGNWRDETNRYLGLKFILAGQAHYAWARLTVHATTDPAHITATLTGYAYETIPNRPIITGRTKGPDVITLEPATLGHLARGASATKGWRGTN